MPANRHIRIALRLVPAVLAGFELRSLCTAAVHLLAGSDRLSAGGLASPETWLLAGLALAVLFFLCETGRGLLPALALGQLLAGVELLPHGHSLISGLVDHELNSGLLAPALAAGLIVTAGFGAFRLAARRLAALPPPTVVSFPAAPRSRSAGRHFIPAPAPLLAGSSGRGPPATALA